jgi:hypothetical protein
MFKKEDNKCLKALCKQNTKIKTYNTTTTTTYNEQIKKKPKENNKKCLIWQFDKICNETLQNRSDCFLSISIKNMNAYLKFADVHIV